MPNDGFVKNLANRGFSGIRSHVCENGRKSIWLLRVISTTYMVFMLPFFENEPKADSGDGICELFLFHSRCNYRWL